MIYSRLPIRGPLEDAARSYCLEVLELGKTLSSFLLDQYRKADGTIEAIVPQHANLGSADPKSGGLSNITQGSQQSNSEAISDGFATASASLLSLIKSHLDSLSKLCIIEDFAARRGDPALSRYKTPLAYHDHEVYHLLSRAQKDDVELARTLQLSSSLPSSVVCLTRLERPLPSPGSEISVDELRGCAEMSASIAIDAFDGEGYIIWSRR